MGHKTSRDTSCNWWGPQRSKAAQRSAAAQASGAGQAGKASQ